MNSPGSQRVEQRRRLVELGRRYAERVRLHIGPATVLLYGSVARGDFNLWSDVDILVVAPGLPEDPLQRSQALYELGLAGLEPKGYLPAEYKAVREQQDPFVREVEAYGLVLVDDLALFHEG